MGITATTSPRAASRDWRGPCGRRWRSIHARRAVCRPPRDRFRIAMTSTYTLHVPDGAEPGDPEALDKAEVVKDGFSWGAFLFTFLWFFVNRLWLTGIGILIAVVALPAVLQTLGVGTGTA